MGPVTANIMSVYFCDHKSTSFTYDCTCKGYSQPVYVGLMAGQQNTKI